VKLESDRVTIASLETKPIPFYLDLPDVLGPVTSAIHLEGRALRQSVAVRAIARKVELVADPAVIDLGDLTPGAEREFIAGVVNVGEIAAELREAYAPGELEVWIRKATVRPGEGVTLTGVVRVNTEQTGERVWTTVRLEYGLKLRCEANVVAPMMPKVLAAAAATGALIAGGALSVAVEWWLGVPVALAGLLIGAWLFWREMR
jgi:hypothetical protein